MKHNPEDCGYICWIDLECTGNKPHDQIIEVGAIITNRELEPLGTYHANVAAPRQLIAGMDEVVVQMHTKNGLLKDLEDGHCISLDKCDANITDWIKSFEAKDHIPFAGSGVAHYDRKYIDKDLPKFSKHLTYWPYDVGVIRRSFKLWGLPDIDRNDTKTHRALDDAYVHLEDFKRYRGKIWLLESYKPLS